MNDSLICPKGLSEASDGAMSLTSSGSSGSGGAQPSLSTTFGARANDTAALPSTPIPPLKWNCVLVAGGTGACNVNSCGGASNEGAKAAEPSVMTVCPPAIREGVAVGWARISVANCGTGRAFSRAARTESRTKSCITVCWRKRTSVFEG